MKKFKKVGICAIVLTMVLIIFLIVSAVSPDEVYYTEDISNYNTENYLVDSRVFPETIPDNAEVVSFSYYSYWNEDKDMYLELKFDSVEEMDDYLNSVKSSCELNNTEKNTADYFMRVDDAYDESYIELICTRCATYSQEEYYTGYEFVLGEDDVKIRSNFGVICYSYDDLTVIHAYINGTFSMEENDHVPKYLEHFNVPLTEENSRKMFLER